MMNDRVSPVRLRIFRRSTGTISIVVVVLVLVGSLLVVMNVTHHGNLFSGIEATGGKPCTLDEKAPAPVQFSEGAGQSGLYAARSEGLYRFGVQNGHLTPIWFYSMGWCPNIPTPTPSGFADVGTPPTPNIITPATVANGIVYFGVLEDSGIYLYALHSSNGTLLWRVKVGNGRGMKGPLTLRGLIYVSTTYDNTGNYNIFAFDAQKGTIRWSYKYPQNINDRNGVGMSDAGDNAIFVVNGDRFFALNATSGKLAWTTLSEGDQQATAAQFFDGVLYISSSSTCFNCVVQPATSVIYACNPASGTKLWSSQLVAGFPSPAYEAQGVVYYGTQAGYVYALQAKDGTEIWHTSVGGEVRTLPQVIGGTVYVGAGLFNTATNNPNTDPGYIVALNIVRGKHVWSSPLSSNQYTGYEPIVAGDYTIFLGTRPSFIDTFDSSHGMLAQQYTVPSGQDAFNLNNMPVLTYVV